jgi:hypothetical protein
MIHRHVQIISLSSFHITIHFIASIASIGAIGTILCVTGPQPQIPMRVRSGRSAFPGAANLMPIELHIFRNGRLWFPNTIRIPMDILSAHQQRQFSILLGWLVSRFSSVRISFTFCNVHLIVYLLSLGCGADSPCIWLPLFANA